MPIMHQLNDLVDYECPNCGYIKKAKLRETVCCPKCQPDFTGYVLRKEFEDEKKSNG